MKKIILIISLIFISTHLFSQTTIKMKRSGGVSTIPCKVNGLDLELIFDTGANDVSISLTEAALMYKNGKLTKSDIIGTSNYLNANGEITEGIVINIKEIEIAGLKMTNIKASVVKNLDAPLLLGQTAISKLGKIQLDLNNNTLTILNGKGNYDYSNYSLVDKLNKYYKDFSVVKIEKRDNKEGLNFSYTIPQKWKEEKVTNNILFKNYNGSEYPFGCFVSLNIGLQTLPFLYNNYDSCQIYVEYVNSLIKNVSSSFKSISVTQTDVSFCKTIKNVFLTKDEEINKLSCQYFIFCGNKSLCFIYSIYSLDLNKIISSSAEFEEFCNAQVSNIVVYNALEHAATCTIQSNAIENKKDISIILNNACNWFKTDGSSELNLFNSSTKSSLNIGITDKFNSLKDLDLLSADELLKFKNLATNFISKSEQLLTSDIVTISKKKYIHFTAKSKNDNYFILSESYNYVINNRSILFVSVLKEKEEADLIVRFKKSQSELEALLSGIEIIGKKSENADDYFNKGLIKAQTNDFKGAIIDFNNSLNINPQLAEAYFNRGYSKFNLQNFTGAIDDYDKIISLSPNFAKAYYNRGLAKFQLKDYKGALVDFNKTIELQSDFTDAYLNRGLMKILLGSKESGCIDLKKASEMGSTKADKARKEYCK